MKRKINVREIFEKHDKQIWLTVHGINMACGIACLVGKELNVEKEIAMVCLPIELVNITVGAYGLYTALTEE